MFDERVHTGGLLSSPPTVIVSASERKKYRVAVYLLDVAGRILAYITAGSTFEIYAAEQNIAGEERAEFERIWNQLKAEFDALPPGMAMYVPSD